MLTGLLTVNIKKKEKNGKYHDLKKTITWIWKCESIKNRLLFAVKVISSYKELQ